MKFFRTILVSLALLLSHGGCRGEPFPDATLVAVASPNNNILFERAIDGLSSSNLSWDDPAKPIKIQSNVPLTVQIYDWSDVSTENNPMQADEGRILITSNCNTGETTAIPNVQVRREGGEILIEAKLTGVPADEASRMPFLQSSSYDAVYYEAGCGWIEGTASPAYVGITRPPQPTPSPVEAPASQTACLTESDCKAMQQRAGFASFHSGEYRTKGCFFKEGTGKAFWGRGGTAEEKSNASLPGLQKRLWCEGPEEVEPPKPPPPQAEGVCTTKEQCDQKRLEMGIASFRAGAYPTKGCFAKGGNAYWGIGGSDEDRSKPDLPGQQARIFCSESEENERCEIGPMAKPGNPCTGGEFCQLDTGVCNNKSGIHVGTCEAKPEDCIAIFQPVCGCDGKTYSNSCKAHAKGISISRPGQCQKANIPCFTKRECDEQRKQTGIASFYSGTFATTTKGCFLKGGKAFFAEGSEAAMSEATLPGAQERLWCNGNGATEIKSALQPLQQENTAPTLHHDSVASSACSFKPFMLGSLLHHVTSAKADLDRSRKLDTCTYNVEVLLSGCNDMSKAADIKVKAPKARAITSVTKLEQEKVDQELDRVLEDGTHLYRADYRIDASVTFPDSQAVALESSVDSYSDLPPFDEWQCSVIVCGRPFSDSMGNSLLASSCSTDGTGQSSSWLGRTLTLPRRVQSTSTNATINPELGREWTKNALSEHASVASFAAFNIALMTNHAPSDLVEDSLRAALDEVRHTRVSFEIASALVGEEVGPGPLPPSSHQFEKNLTALAMSVAKEGCVDETLSALVAAAEVELIEEVLETGSASKYAGVSRDTLAWIRDELRTISIDESRHSLLAWRTLQWVCTVDDAACDDAKTNVLTELKLTAAFKRFGQRFEGHPLLHSHMKNAWTEIHTSWLSRLNADRTTVEAPAYSADAIGGLARDVPDKPPLLALVAENVASGLSQ